MKKLIRTIILAFGLVNFCLIGVGCSTKGPIPNGNYYCNSEIDNVFYYTEKSIRNTYGWEIDGTDAELWTSSSIIYKAKIVEKKGRIYFEGYKWKDLFSSVERGNEIVYEVIYDEVKNTITLITIND